MAKTKKVEFEACEFTIDPMCKEFKELRGVCEPGNPYRCLIATMASIKIKKRMTVRLDHKNWEGVIGLSHDGMRYERPMTAEEVTFAQKFDLGNRMRRSLTVKVDLNDGTWKTRPAETGKSYEDQKGTHWQEAQQVRRRSAQYDSQAATGPHQGRCLGRVLQQGHAGQTDERLLHPRGAGDTGD